MNGSCRHVLDCKIITSDTEVGALAAEWRALHAQAGSSVFTDYDWFAVWWRTVGNVQGRMLHIVTGRIGGRLVALLPLAVIRRRGLRILQAIGAEAFYYCDTLCEDPAQAHALWCMAKSSPHYDFAHIRDVCPDSTTEAVLSSLATLRDRSKTLSLRLQWRTPAEWKATFSDNFRKNLAKAERQLAAKGTLAYTICEAMPIPQNIIESMVAHKTLWCEEHGLQGMFDQPAILSYYRQMAEHTAQQHTLALAWLACGDAIIACHILFKYKKTLHSYVLGTDAEWNKYSPGNLAHVHAIAWAIENGFELFDHMQGDFAYKFKFANQVRECREYTFSRTLRGFVGEKLFIHRRMAKRALEKRG